MSRLTCFLISLFLNTGTGNAPFFAAQLQQLPSGTPEVRGAWVARQIDERDTGRDVRMSLRMRLFDRQNRARERALTLIAMKGGAGRAVPGDRSLIRFTQPADIRGTAFLTWEQSDATGGGDDRFLYLPSLGRVRRIAASETQESFVGSDFTYEDIGGRRLDDYNDLLIDDTSSWKAPDGQLSPVYRLESRRKDAAARFPRVISLVRKDSFVVVHADIYNKRGEIQKTFDARRLGQVTGHWTVLDMSMVDVLARTHTDLTVEQVAYDVGLKPDDFSRRELERPLVNLGRSPGAIARLYRP